MFNFIHAADIHLDSPLRGLTRFEGAPVARIQAATREAFQNLIQLALDERVAFILIAGDLWDGDWPDVGPGLFFIEQAKRLQDARIPIFVVKGNHDAESKVTSAIREWPENVTFFDHRKPGTAELAACRVAIHGQSYGQQHVGADLSAGYPKPVAGVFNIGLLHTSLEDASTDYAPAKVANLVRHGYEYWALGHVHQRQEVSRDGVEIVFPGNIQGRSMRETGEKGCLLVTVGDDHGVTREFRALDTVRWQEVAVRCGDEDLEGEVRQALRRAVREAEGRLLAARLVITGSVQNGQGLRDRVTGVAVEVGEVWVERIEVRRESAGDGAVGRRSWLASGLLGGEIGEVLAGLRADDGEVSRWLAEFAGLRERLGEEGGSAARILGERDAFRELLEKVGGEL
jgi:exonuclease SbcD